MRSKLARNVTPNVLVSQEFANDLLTLLSEGPAIEHYTVDEIDALPIEVVTARLAELGYERLLPFEIVTMVPRSETPTQTILDALGCDLPTVEKVDNLGADEVQEHLARAGIDFNCNAGLDCFLKEIGITGGLAAVEHDHGLISQGAADEVNITLPMQRKAPERAVGLKDLDGRMHSGKLIAFPEDRANFRQARRTVHRPKWNGLVKLSALLVIAATIIIITSASTKESNRSFGATTFARSGKSLLDDVALEDLIMPKQPTITKVAAATDRMNVTPTPLKLEKAELQLEDVASQKITRVSRRQMRNSPTAHNAVVAMHASPQGVRKPLDPPKSLYAKNVKGSIFEGLCDQEDAKTLHVQFVMFMPGVTRIKGGCEK